MKKTLLQLHIPLFILAVFAGPPLAWAQSTWGGGGGDQNWSTTANWSAGGAPANDAVTFPDGAFPITTNVIGAVNNIVPANTLITSLTYLNNSANGDYDTTLIPPGVTLTVSGGVTLSDSSTLSSAAIKGGGSLIAGTSGTANLYVETTGTGALLLDLSGLNTFVFNYGAASPGNLDIANQQLPAGGTQTLNLAAVSNNITVGTLNAGNNNTRGTVTINLGNGTNIINADTLNIGVNKIQSTMQFINNAGGGLTIANHTGTGRATINLGTETSSGSTSSVATGNMLFDGGTVNILVGTLTMASRNNRADSPGALANLVFNSGTVDATFINMATNTSGGGYPTANLSVGGSGILKAGAGGISMAAYGGTPGNSTLVITNGGTVICSNNIYLAAETGTNAITMSGGNLIMQSLAGTIGVANTAPIGTFNLTNSTLTLPVTTSSASVAVINFNPDTATTTTINIGTMPSITAYPSSFPVITYTTPGGNLATGGILPNIALGTLPNTFGTFKGYLSNDIPSLTVWLVVTNGPLAGAAEWGGGVNNQWNTTSLNWTNNGFAVAYQDGDFVTFDDFGQTNLVNLTGTRKPATLTFNNNVLNYTLTGVGSISGPVTLTMNGNASLTLAESGGDNFSLGITNVNSGTIILDNTNSSISGGLMVASGGTVQIGNNDGGGALPSGPLDDEGTLIFHRANNLTVSVAIPGAGALTQQGSGTLALSANNTYSGNTTVSAGTLALTGSGSISNSPQVSVSSATLDVSAVTGASGVTTLQALSLTNATLNVKAGYLQTNLNVSSLGMGGTASTINIISLPAIAYYPATVTLLQSASPITGYNFVQGTLPAASPANVGTISESLDQMSVVLTLTSGPTNTRPSVTWSGVDALNNVNTNWSDALNWQTPGVPTAAEPVSFNDAAAAPATPFDQSGGVGSGSSVDQANINNIVDVSLTNAALSYANTANSFQNTQIAPGKTLTINGSVTVNGSSGNVTILGTGAALTVNNPNHNNTFNVENGSVPMLDMSGLDTFTATVGQIGVGFDIASSGSDVNGVWYLARTNTITTGVGSFSTGTALVVGGANTQNATGTGQIYLGQTNVLYVDGILLGLGGASAGSLITFNPAFTNPVAYIRGISGNSSRVTSWSLGDNSVNLNNGAASYGHLNDFSAGTLNALVNTLTVGRGVLGNGAGAHTPNSQVMGTFNMGSGILDVTTLNIGQDGSGVEGAGIGIMNVSTNGTLLVNSLGLGVGVITNTAGTLNLTNATLVVSNGITIGTGTNGGTLDCEFSTVKILNGTIGTPGAPLTTLILDGSTLQLSVNGSTMVTNIVATNVITEATTTINIAPIANVSGTVVFPLISYVGTDPTTNNLALGTLSAGYTGSLVDDVANSSIDLSITSLVKPTPHFTSVGISGTTLTIQGINGADSGPYVLLGTTNLTLPLSQWTRLLTNNFAPNGNFNLSTNIINPALPQQFYLLLQ